MSLLSLWWSGFVGGDRCSVCGQASAPPPSGSFSRGSRSIEPELVRGLEDERYSTRIKEIDYLGANFYVQRNDAQSWFRAPISLIRSIRADQEAFYKKSWESILRAMGASKISWGRMSMEGPDQVSGKISTSSVSFLLDFGDQSNTLRLNQICPVSANTEGRLVDLPVLTHTEYVDRKSSAVKSLASNAKVRSWIRENPEAYYAAKLYAERAWTLEVARRSGALLRRDRMTLSSPASLQRLQGGPNSVLRGLEMRLVLPLQAEADASKGLMKENLDAFEYAASARDLEDNQPSIMMFDPDLDSQVGIFNISDAGTLSSFRAGRIAVPLLAKTTKMSAPSLSLPAGSHRAGGTCIMAGVEVESEHRSELMVCNSCYATKANYGYPESMCSTHVRLEWVIQSLDKGFLVDGLVGAVESYARHTTKGDSSSPRASQELGVWDASARRIKVPSTGKTVSYANVTRFTSYASLGIKHKDSSELFYAMGVPNGSVCGFFRVHDAGDFTATAKLMSRYIEGWGEVAKRLPYVQFWAPTRVWAMKRRVKELTPQDQAWLGSGAVAGSKIDLKGSLARVLTPVLSGSSARMSTLKSIGGRLAERISLRLSDLLPEDMAKSHISDLLENHGDQVDTGGAYSPGEIEPVLTDGAQVKTPASFAYVPRSQDATAKALAKVGSIQNFSMRPSSLYVKTPENPAFIPSVKGISAGSGVNAKWGSIWSWLGALQLDAVAESRYASTAKRYAKEAGKDADSYVPVFDNEGRPAYQCPVYSLLPVLDESSRPLVDSKGQPELSEAKSCQAAGCRACWLAKTTPITYGYH
jgi:hypothetical protein